MGAEESFREYVGARLAALSRVAYLLTGDRQLAEDLAQTTLIRVADRWERLTATGDPDAYVRRCSTPSTCPPGGVGRAVRAAPGWRRVRHRRGRWRYR